MPNTTCLGAAFQSSALKLTLVGGKTGFLSAGLRSKSDSYI